MSIKLHGKRIRLSKYGNNADDADCDKVKIQNCWKRCPVWHRNWQYCHILAEVMEPEELARHQPRDWPKSAAEYAAARALNKIKRKK